MLDAVTPFKVTKVFNGLTGVVPRSALPSLEIAGNVQKKEAVSVLLPERTRVLLSYLLPVWGGLM